MAEDPKVTLKARVDLVDSVAGAVEKGEEFETTERNAKAHTRANAVDGPGETAEEVSSKVALDEYEKKSEARKNMVGGRQRFRNLTLDSAQAGNVGTDSPMPGSVLIGKDERPRTNAQVQDPTGDGADKLPLESVEGGSKKSGKSNKSDS
jgi:hypothetical protein